MRTTTILRESRLASGRPFPAYGPCQAPTCPRQAQDPLRLCRPHVLLYRVLGQREGMPGGAALERGWTYKVREGPVAVSYQAEGGSWRWADRRPPVRHRARQVSLLGLPPLVKAEIQRAVFPHTHAPIEGAVRPLSGLQQLADLCRRQKVVSLADINVDGLPHRAATAARLSLKHPQVVYFTREETKAADFLQVQHFGVSWGPVAGHLDLTNVTQHSLVTTSPIGRRTGVRHGSLRGLPGRP